jgi:hypothetical protein
MSYFKIFIISHVKIYANLHIFTFLVLPVGDSQKCSYLSFSTVLQQHFSRRLVYIIESKSRDGILYNLGHSFYKISTPSLKKEKYFEIRICIMQYNGYSEGNLKTGLPLELQMLELSFKD